ncbi:DUF1572 family protein [Hymenobacter sp.]|uniref:DUF1572 family protein n=1 Tax=Hymenobacter sp. TaxID=1898978 RepID=UPI00286C6A8C|nr:DUF1572 family protein [Hymenobacter sp.]
MFAATPGRVQPIPPEDTPARPTAAGALTRRRDAEFDEPTSAAAVPALRREWEAAWRVLFDLLDELTPDDLLRTVAIRGEEHAVLAAVQRQVAHYAYHVGQLVQLAKSIRGEDFRFLSIPRGQSEQFNQQMAGRR